MSDGVEKFVDGSWYEQQYSTPGSHYSGVYDRDLTAEEEAYLRYHVGLALAWLGLEPSSVEVLELGAGVGRYLKAWKSFVPHVEGIEISEHAAARARKLLGDVVKTGSATNLGAWGAREFDIVTSAAFFEHVAKEITADVLRESMRVARYGAHFIPNDPGDDPSHIHVQSHEAWVEEILFALGSDYQVTVVDNVVTPNQALFIICRGDDVPSPLQRHPQSFRLGESK